MWFNLVPAGYKVAVWFNLVLAGYEVAVWFNLVLAGYEVAMWFNLVPAGYEVAVWLFCKLAESQETISLVAWDAVALQVAGEIASCVTVP